MDEQHASVIREAILDAQSFRRAIFSGRQRGHSATWQRVTLRPVLLRGARFIQCAFYDGRQTVTKNYHGTRLAQELDILLELPFGSFYIETSDQRLQLQVTRRGKLIVHRHGPPSNAHRLSLAHDRHKDLLLPVGEPDEFLQAIGVLTPEGLVRPRMRRKFRQVNEFLKLIFEKADLETARQSPLRIVDCGCGSAHLTLAIHHYLNHKLSLPSQVTGIDVKEDLVQRLSAQVREWGWEGIDFELTRILEYKPAEPPHVVIALHACDTATDEALAQAVRWGSEMIFCVPCCHHHLQQQMDRRAIPAEFHLVARHAALRQRLGDLLTDALRAQILRILGYSTDVVEFISTEHTAKNLMIRATRSGSPGAGRAVAEYSALLARWKVRPFLGELLAQELAELGV